MNIVEDEFAGFPAVMVEWSDYRLAVTPTIGGRILGFSYRGMEAFFRMPSLMGKQFNVAVPKFGLVQARRNELGMKLYGGFKTWLAPQHLWGNSPYIDLDLAPYSIHMEQHKEHCKVKLTSPICRETGMQFLRKVVISDHSPEVKVEMGMTNHNKTKVTYGLWDVTQLVSPGKVYFSTRAEDMKVWNIPGAAQQPPAWIDDTTAKVDCGLDIGAFKIGTRHSEGWLLNVIPFGSKFLGYIKKFPSFDGKWCGHGCAIEVFNAGEYPYFEAEVHSPLITLHPGQSYSFKQVWQLFEIKDNYETDIHSLLRGDLL